MPVFKCHSCNNNSSMEVGNDSKTRICLVCQAPFTPLRLHPEDFAFFQAQQIVKDRKEKLSAENALQEALDRGERQKNILIARN